MDDDELNAMLALEESCLQLPLSQGALFMDADVVDVPGEPGAPVTPPHSSVGFSSSPGTGSWTPSPNSAATERAAEPVVRRRVARKRAAPEYESERAAACERELMLDESPDMQEWRLKVYNASRQYFLKSVWGPENPKSPSEKYDSYKARCWVNLKAAPIEEKMPILNKHWTKWHMRSLTERVRPKWLCGRCN